MPDIQMTKKCCRCRKEKPVSEFHKKQRSPDGHAAQCRKCVSEYQASWYAQRKKPNGRALRRSKPRRSAAQKSCKDGYLRESLESILIKLWEIENQRTELNRQQIVLEVTAENIAIDHRIKSCKFHFDAGEISISNGKASVVLNKDYNNHEDEV